MEKERALLHVMPAQRAPHTSATPNMQYTYSSTFKNGKGTCPPARNACTACPAHFSNSKHAGYVLIACLRMGKGTCPPAHNACSMPCILQQHQACSILIAARLRMEKVIFSLFVMLFDTNSFHN